MAHMLILENGVRDDFFVLYYVKFSQSIVELPPPTRYTKKPPMTKYEESPSRWGTYKYMFHLSIG